VKNYSKYLISTQLEEEWGLYVTTVGYTKIDINQSYPLNSEHPESHAFNWNSGRILDGYYLVFISNGCGLFESAVTRKQYVKEGDCFLLFPGIWHRYKPDTQSGWEEYWVGFKGSYANDLMKKIFSADDPFINAGLNNNLLKLLHELLEWVQNAPVGYHQIISGLTLQMLGLIYSISKNKETAASNTDKLIEEAKFLFRETIQEPAKMESIIKKLPVSYSKLRKDFKNLTGQSPNQYQLNLRLDKAKELLANTGLSISEIAYQTGFESVSYLSRIFKKKIQISPKAYRQQFFQSPLNTTTHP
jgi:AraC-like DNA-binding protein